MKKTIFKSLALASILFFTGCSNKVEQINNSNIKSEQKAILTKVLEIDCRDGVLTDNIYQNLGYFDSSNSRNDYYNAEVNMCKVDDSSVKIELLESININNQSFTNKEQKNLILQPCGKEKKIYIQNRAISICKGADGFTRLTIELPSTAN